GRLLRFFLETNRLVRERLARSQKKKTAGRSRNQEPTPRGRRKEELGTRSPPRARSGRVSLRPLRALGDSQCLGLCAPVPPCETFIDCLKFFATGEELQRLYYRLNSIRVSSVFHLWLLALARHVLFAHVVGLRDGPRRTEHACGERCAEPAGYEWGNRADGHQPRR